jgi:hypothetical protein
MTAAGMLPAYHPTPSAIRLASNDVSGVLRLASRHDQAPRIVLPVPEETIDPYVALQTEAAARMQATVPADLKQYFDVYLYVSKAAHGSLAQHMYVFHKADDGSLVYEDSFPVSTGRERREKYFTSTPVGLFELDPNRFYRKYRSRTWGGARMPWAMFLNASIDGRPTGIALHSAAGHQGLLGMRASGGCVRMPNDRAAWLFKRFKREERGDVPVFATDGERGDTNRSGQVALDENGVATLAEGYRVLLFIENYKGSEPALVAVL